MVNEGKELSFKKKSFDFIKKNAVMFIALLAAIITCIFVPVDEKYIDELFSNVVSLCSLDRDMIKNGGASEKAPSDTANRKLPAGSVALLSVLCTVWAVIGIYFLASLRKKRKK